jgi:V8-like Glu-specific endopeptidase
MPVDQQQLDEVIQQFAQQDPALYEELQKKVKLPAQESVNAVAEEISVAAALPSASEPGVTELTERFTLETIVRPLARPVLIIRDNQATTEFLGPDSEVWRARIQTAKPILDRIIPAVGRVEVTNHPDFPWLGTGWLVADDIIVTNRHVAQEFGRRGANGFTFRAGVNGAMTSRVDFLEEDQRANSLEYAVQSILFIASSSEPDVAFLRLSKPVTGKPLPPPIELADAITGDELIATIGYPARDSRIPDQDLVLRIFGDIYDKKRLAPGQIISVSADELQHDCTTAGGNSGSPIIELATGRALGLHFSGLFMQANFGVPAAKVRELLRRAQQGEVTVRPRNTPDTSSQASTPPPPTANSYTFQLNIPIEVTVKVGVATPIYLPNTMAGATGTITSGDVHERALQAAREAFGNDPDVIEIRLGYRFKRGWITDERVVVVETRKKLTTAELAAEGKSPLPPQILGIGIDVRTSALRDQLESLGVDLSVLEAPARPGKYREPTNVFLEPVKEQMRVVFHVSPDSAFLNFKDFLGRVNRQLTATMYEWDPNHISDAIAQAMQGNNKSLRMVTQKKGTQEAVDNMKHRIGAKFKHVWASVGKGKLIPSAYHIKVASRDGEELWLSSGNWKDSNQPNIDPAGTNSTQIGPLKRHNREWHAVIANRKLATMFQKFIEFDFREAERVPLEEGLEAVFPDVFVPEVAFMEGLEQAVHVQYFDPLVRDREFEIQPLLTPDRDSRGHHLFLDHAIKMMKKGTEKIYVENQSFNLLDEENNNDDFVEFFGLLRDKQQAGVDVRVIFRDAREFGASNGPAQQKLLERLKDFGFDTDFIRVQMRCHTKGIIVDGKEVMLGSHNLTNQGSLFNRDASLLVRDPEVAAYFEKVFLFDWNTLATQEVDELVGGMRLASQGEETPVGFRRVSVAELLGES